MIIWLASYPKSGNTFLRSILGTYFFSKDGNFNFDQVYKIAQFPSLFHFNQMNIDICIENVLAHIGHNFMSKLRTFKLFSALH